MLEAFAYWKPTSSGGIRWGTLLTAGDNPAVVGNAVLKNPGSAEPIDTLFEREDGRLEFTPDATMYALADLFKLESGTIRLFNLLDIRAVDPDEAVRMLNRGVQESSMENVAEQIATGPRVPTYLGWGDLWRHPKLEAKARRIFEAVQYDTPCLDPVMERNRFFHPLYLMRYGNLRPECYEAMMRFREIVRL